MADFTLDLARGERIGLDEAIFCAGKTPEQIAGILDAFPSGGGLLLTRLEAAKFDALPQSLRDGLDSNPCRGLRSTAPRGRHARVPRSPWSWRAPPICRWAGGLSHARL